MHHRPNAGPIHEMGSSVVGLAAGAVFGWTLAWAQVTDPHVIRNMLLLREFDVFLLMGSAVAVAAVGQRVLRGINARTIVTREAIGWRVERPGARHILGSVLFGTGWSVAGTCPGPVAAMLGEGRFAGLPVVLGLLIGVALQRTVLGRTSRRGASAPAEPCV